MHQDLPWESSLRNCLRIFQPKKGCNRTDTQQFWNIISTCTFSSAVRNVARNVLCSFRVLSDTAYLESLAELLTAAFSLATAPISHVARSLGSTYLRYRKSSIPRASMSITRASHYGSMASSIFSCTKNHFHAISARRRTWC